MNDFEVLYQSEYGGSGTEETGIFENQGEFAAFWAQVTHQPAQSAPHIDFSKKIVIARHFQSQNSGGTAYNIESVSSKGSDVVITYTASRTSDMATMAITNPLMILTVDKVENPNVTFRDHSKK